MLSAFKMALNAVKRQLFTIYILQFFIKYDIIIMSTTAVVALVRVRRLRMVHIRCERTVCA